MAIIISEVVLFKFNKQLLFYNFGFRKQHNNDSSKTRRNTRCIKHFNTIYILTQYTYKFHNYARISYSVLYSSLK